MKELADDGIPFAVTCRVLKLARQLYVDDSVFRRVVVIRRRIDEDELGFEFESARFPHLTDEICCGGIH